MTKYLMVACWLAVVIPGNRCGWIWARAPFHPRKSNFPKAKRTTAVPARSAMRLSALHSTASGVDVLPIVGSYGKLLVYEYACPGRLALDAQAVQAKNAVRCCSVCGSVMYLAGKPALTVGWEK